MEKKRKSALPDSPPPHKKLLVENVVLEDTKKLSDEIEEETIENDEPPKSPENIRDDIKEKFLVHLPEDFYDFFKFCQSLDSNNPLKALYSDLKLELCGPYDVLSGHYKSISTPVKCWLTHCRYFHDCPEMLTIIKGDPVSQFHLAYFRDTPEDDPVFVVSALTSNSGKLIKLGPNIFAAINTLMDEHKKKSQSLINLQKKLQNFAKKLNYSLEKISKGMKERDKKSVCKTLHGAGMVVPVDENDVGYREVPLSLKELASVLNKIVSAKTEDERNHLYSPLDEIVTFIQFANDEGDFGEGLELGLSMLAFHPQNVNFDNASIFNGQIQRLLSLAYQLLNRPVFEQIINAHMDNRRSEL